MESAFLHVLNVPRAYGIVGMVKWHTIADGLGVSEESFWESAVGAYSFELDDAFALLSGAR
jgi:hypothetical protein